HAGRQGDGPARAGRSGRPERGAAGHREAAGRPGLGGGPQGRAVEVPDGERSLAGRAAQRGAAAAGRRPRLGGPRRPRGGRAAAGAAGRVGFVSRLTLAPLVSDWSGPPGEASRAGLVVASTVSPGSHRTLRRYSVKRLSALIVTHRPLSPYAGHRWCRFGDTCYWIRRETGRPRRRLRTVTDAPIGIFDSGVGGLTVVRAILDQLPHEQVVYVGDTAHVPYGPKPIA